MLEALHSTTLIQPEAWSAIRAVRPERLGNLAGLYQGLEYPYQSWIHDWDHSLTESKILLHADGTFSPDRYIQKGDYLTLQNIDQVALKAVLGLPQHICTGKDWNFWPVTHYIRQRIDHIATLLNMTERTPGGMLRSYLHPEYGIFFAASTGNGGLSMDVLRGELLVLKPISLDAWLHMAEAAPLLRRSTTQERLDTIAKRVTSHTIYDRSADPFIQNGGQYVTPVEHVKDITPINDDNFSREIAPPWTNDERNHLDLLQSAIQDHVVLVPQLSTKANYVLRINEIIQDRSPDGLHQAWLDATGIEINDFQSFMEAFRELSKDWEVTVTFNEAHGIVFVDIMAKDVNKGLSQRLIKKVIQYHIQKDICPQVLPKILSFSLADNNHPEFGNDKYIVYRTRSVIVGNPPTRYPRTPDSYPVYTQDLYGDIAPMLQTYLYLYQSTLLTCPSDQRSVIDNLITKLNEEHRLKSHLSDNASQIL